jgi:hypothetical protein
MLGFLFLPNLDYTLAKCAYASEAPYVVWITAKELRSFKIFLASSYRRIFQQGLKNIDFF